MVASWLTDPFRDLDEAAFAPLPLADIGSSLNIPSQDSFNQAIESENGLMIVMPPCNSCTLYSIRLDVKKLPIGEFEALFFVFPTMLGDVPTWGLDEIPTVFIIADPSARLLPQGTLERSPIGVLIKNRRITGYVSGERLPFIEVTDHEPD